MCAGPLGVASIIRRLQLEPHPEGGHYRRTWEHPESRAGRPLGSSILYLLPRGERSHWHRIDAVEQWHFAAGAPLELRLSSDGHVVESHVLGGQVLTGESPQIVVPSGFWQSAISMGDYTLVGCTVTPAFDFGGFELAPAGWEPA